MKNYCLIRFFYIYCYFDGDNSFLSFQRNDIINDPPELMNAYSHSYAYANCIFVHIIRFCVRLT